MAKIGNNMKKILTAFLIGLLIIAGSGAYGQFIENDRSYTIEHEILVSNIDILEDDEYAFIEIEGSDDFVTIPGEPIIPLVHQVFTFPLGTKIVDVEIQCEYQDFYLCKKIQPSPNTNIQIGSFSQKIIDVSPDERIYDSLDSYPVDVYTITKGAGLDDSGHVLFLNVYVYSRYLPLLDLIYIPQKIKINIDYQLPEEPLFTSNEYDMVLITSDQFSSSIQPLVEHKNTIGVRSYLKTIEEIYSEYPGRDTAEQIKYFIKNAIENEGIRYVLIAGDMSIVPMRYCADTVITGVINWYDILSDLYYADIYDDQRDFCSWDSNDDLKYSECYYDYSKRNIEYDIIDDVDMYPDVGVGRLPFSTIDQCEIIVNKIVSYETDLDIDDWFNSVILMGGDTTPNFEDAYEGEWVHETSIGPTMENNGFELTKLYTSLDTFNPESITREISSGAGFVCYAGHGYMDSIATFSPLGGSSISYSIDDVNGLTNEDKLPIIFLDACLTGKIDYDIFDKIMVPLCGMYPYPFVHFVKKITDSFEVRRHFTCFAASFLNTDSGGGVGVIAATQPGLCGLAYDDEEILNIVFGSSDLNMFFFESYDEGISFSDMFVAAQNKYIDKIRGPEGLIIDYTTLHEFNLFGDPSLIIGGYQ